MGHSKVLKFRKVNRDIFEAVKDGRKKIETRAASPKYQSIKTGDELILVCGHDRIKKIVAKIEHFRSTGALLKKYKPQAINPKISSVREARKMWLSFPGYKEKIQKFGLIVWKLN